MGKYLEAVKSYSKTGDDKKMWDQVALIDGVMSEMEEAHPEKFWCIMRKMHCIQYGPHYNESFARYDVSQMWHKNERGERVEGEYWSIAQVTNAIQPYMSRIKNYNVWDAYVALHIFYHDLYEAKKTKRPDTAEAETVEEAVKFFMFDDDAPDGKVWNYVQSIK